MRGLLLDENLPDFLLLPTTLPVVHTRVIGSRLTDSDLWAIAGQHEWRIVSKDADFAERMMTASPPPWVVHLRIGNLRLTEFQDFILRVWPQIEALLPLHKLIIVYHNRLEAVAEGGL